MQSQEAPAIFKLEQNSPRKWCQNTRRAVHINEVAKPKWQTLDVSIGEKSIAKRK
jgi:hypothetical protein